MNNVLTVAELKRRGMAAIEDQLQSGPVHILKRNKPAAVVLSEEQYQQLLGAQTSPVTGLSAVQWLLSQASKGTRSKQDIDRALSRERDW